MAKNYYISGSHNFICDVCGFKHKATEAKLRWDGLMVCPDDWEPRQSLDFVRAKTDKITVPWTRPRPPDVFVVLQQYVETGYVETGYIQEV